jgi:8-oxo-dGTP pyrophosphatase MutT (NUDIX family)
MNISRPQSSQPIPSHAKKIFDGVIFDVYQWEQELFDGTKTTFEKLKRPDTVVVFPVLDDGRIILVEQEQPGDEVYIGATGGRVEEGEDILDAAKRELLEESGYEASEFFLWDAQYPMPKVDWVVFTFIAKGLKKVADMNLDAGEKITLKPASFDEFIAVGRSEKFAEKEIVPKLYEAMLVPEKKEALRKLFRPL